MAVERPLNPKAVQAANEALWQNNPELARRKLTLGPEDTTYRKEWMKSYKESLATQPPPTSGGGSPPNAPCQGCGKASKTGTLVVTVTRLQDGKPVAGANVRIAGPQSRTGSTSGAGQVTFSGLAPGQYTVTASKADHSTETTSATVAAGKTGKANLVLLASVDLGVKVVDKNMGTPIKDATVRITGPSTAQAKTDASGTVRFMGIATGDYRIDAVATGGYLAGTSNVTVREGSTLHTISLVPTSGLAGRVTDTNDGKPIEGATVTLKSNGRTATTDANGNFDFGEVDSGKYDVEASKSGHSATKPVTVSAGTSNSVSLALDTITITSVSLTRSPKKIIHRYNESITFTATVQPSPAPGGLLYHWFVDGVEDATVTGSTLTRQFQPAGTVADRRKDYRIDVRVTSKSAKTKVRVAQNVNVGSAHVAQSNAGMDTLGWTDSSPETFDGISAAEDTSIQANESLTRQIRKQTLADGSTQYGRLQFVSAAGSGDMVTTGYTNRSAALVYCRSSAFNWRREEFDGMLLHEREHCKHRTAATSSSSIWRKLWDTGFASTFAPFTEMFGYFSYVQNNNVSYKYLVDYGAIGSFVREYNLAKTALGSLSGSTKTDAQALVKGCYDNAQFSELREAATEGWDHHVDAP